MSTPNTSTAPVITAELEVVNDKTPATIPPAKTPDRSGKLLSTKGNEVGKQFWFSPLSASELKAKYKKENPEKTGKQITEMVNDSLRSEKDQRTIGAHSMISYLASQGQFADTCKMRKNKSVLEFVPTGASETPGESAAKKALAETTAQVNLMTEKTLQLMALLEKHNIALPEPTAIQG